MSMLFFDDDKYHTKSFKEAVGLPVKTVSTAADCIAMIKSMEEVDILFLDHDCGTEVVRWIVEDEPIIRNIIVHSLNAPAALNMVAKLRQARYNAYYIPFSTLLERIGGMI